MHFGIFAMWVLVGLFAGWLAGFVIKDGGYGLAGDLLLGLFGSMGGSLIFWALELSPGAGPFALAFVAFLGAAIVLVAQRKIWYAPA